LPAVGLGSPGEGHVHPRLPVDAIEIPGVAAVVVSLAIEDGRIARIYALSYPDTPTRLDTETLLTRSN
jgi:hypothetical protein